MGFAICDLRFAIGRPRAEARGDRRRLRRCVNNPVLPRGAAHASIANRKSKFGNAFTLVELIISIALVLIVMLGVNFVFRMTGDTIGSGQVLNDQVRNNRGAQAVMFDDFGKVMRDGPALIIRSRAVPAFRNQADQNGDGDGNPLTIDQNADGDDGDVEDRVYGSNYNTRNHRVDTVSFFAQGLFRRQTGGGTLASGGGPVDELISGLTSSEAWIWYGHLILPDNNGNFTNVSPFTNTPPTQADNPNNFYSTQWTLGRVGTLLREPDGNNRILSGSGTSQIANHYIREAGGLLSPLSQNSQSTAGGTIQFQDCRFDLAGISSSRFRQKLSGAIATGAPANWWEEMMSGTPNGTRFQCFPYITRPISSASYSQQSPIFLQSCTQFIVEYAGDFLKQNVNGNVTEVTDAFVKWDIATSSYVSGTTDGQIDYVYNPLTGARETLWYGLPRNTRARPGEPAPRIRAVDGDVVPLRDWWQALTSGQNAGQVPPFERYTSVGNGNLPVVLDYWGAGGLPQYATYTCAWGPSDTVRPKLIRVTIVLDDTAGRLAEGQTLEYVFELP